MNFNFGNLISAAAGAVSSVASAVEGTVSSVASAVSSKLGGIAGAVLGTMSAIASVSEDGNIDDEDMEDMLTEVYKLLVGANIVSFGEGSTSDSDDLSDDYPL
jgi:phage-related protein